MAKTLKELIQETNCRKGEPDGTTKFGAYWEPVESPCLRAFGAESSLNRNEGQPPLVNWHLKLQYYRSGEVHAVLERYARHVGGPEYGAGNWYFDRSSLLELETIEEIVADLKKGVDISNRRIKNPHATSPENEYLRTEKCYSDNCYKDLRDALLAQGMPEFLPGPDEEIEQKVE